MYLTAWIIQAKTKVKAKINAAFFFFFNLKAKLKQKRNKVGLWPKFSRGLRLRQFSPGILNSWSLNQ